MQSISTTEFVRHMGAYVDRVERGEAFRITRYGKPIVVVEPIDKGPCRAGRGPTLTADGVTR